MSRLTRASLVLMLAAVGVFWGTQSQGQESNGHALMSGIAAPRVDEATDAAVQFPPFECGYQSPDEVMSAFRDAIQRGEIVDPAGKPRPVAVPGAPRVLPPPCISTPTSADIFLFEDSAGLLLTNFSDGQLFDLMTDGANALIAANQDNFDFIGFWINFVADHEIGAAFYLGIFNDVSGIGQGAFNFRAGIGLASSEVEGYVMMWDINHGYWQPGTGASADFTRLALGQEFEHRFAMFLPDLLDGRRLQGDNRAPCPPCPCGRSAHWNRKVDGQGSGMEIAEWVGSSPATRIGGSINFNTDILNSVFSYTDLYLMGYVSGAEMDAGNSELRYMDMAAADPCSSPYAGAISTFGSSDIIAAAGSRNPPSTSAQQNFKTGWVMIHQPGAPPTAAELSKAVGILAQHTIDWNTSTIGRGTMCNTLSKETECDTNDDCPGKCNICPPATLRCEIDPDCCESDAQCTGKCDFCNPTTNRCEKDPADPDCCESDEQCPDKCDFCNLAINQCEKLPPEVCCDTDDQCFPLFGPKCAVCNLTTNTCEKALDCCDSDEQCPGKCDFCNLMINQCEKLPPEVCCDTDDQCFSLFDPACAVCVLATNQCACACSGCVNATANAPCNDSDVCTMDTCTPGLCDPPCAIEFGDVNGDTEVNFGDVLATLAAIGNYCSLPSADVDSVTCVGDTVLNFADVITVLGAIGAGDICGCGNPGSACP